MFTTHTSGNYSSGGFNSVNITCGNTGGNITTINPIYTTGTASTSTAGNIVYPQIVTHKKCRDCNHSHLNDTCVEFQEWGAVTFVKCQCKEYAPKDNLEYLEHLYDKKQKKESTPSL